MTAPIVLRGVGLFGALGCASALLIGAVERLALRWRS